MPYVLDLQNRTISQPKPAPSKPPVKKENKPQTPAAVPTAYKEAARETLPESISWQAPEYQHVPKSRDWYWAVGILTIGLFVVALLFSNFLFGIFVLLGGFTIALYGARAPQTVAFSLSVEGIRIQNRVYPYESLQSFWIFYHPPHVKELSVESQKMIMPHIKIPLENQNPAKIRAYLQQFLPERQQEESLIDVGMRYFGF